MILCASKFNLSGIENFIIIVVITIRSVLACVCVFFFFVEG